MEQEIRKKKFFLSNYYSKLSLISKMETVKYLFCETRKYKTLMADNCRSTDNKWQK